MVNWERNNLIYKHKSVQNSAFPKARAVTLLLLDEVERNADGGNCVKFAGLMLECSSVAIVGRSSGFPAKIMKNKTKKNSIC